MISNKDNIVRRVVKGSSLTYEELDGNFNELSNVITDTVEIEIAVADLDTAINIRVDDLSAVVSSKQDALPSSTGQSGKFLGVNLDGSLSYKTFDSSPAETIQSILCYYGYPIAFSNLWSVPAVVESMSTYNHYICGAGYQAPSHEEYASTQAIISALRSKGTKVWGYVATSIAANPDASVIQDTITQWNALGVDGIFLDEFGFDYGNTRTRQNQIISMCRAISKPYVANAWNFIDVMSDTLGDLPSWMASDDSRRLSFIEKNPTNLPLDRNIGDVFLIENYGVDTAGVSTCWGFLEKVDQLTEYNNANAKKMTLWGLSVVLETTGNTEGYRNVDLTMIAPFTTMSKLSSYLFAGALVHKLGAWGLGGFEFGSNGYPVKYEFYSKPSRLGDAGDAVWSSDSFSTVNSFGKFNITVKTGSTTLTTANTTFTITGPGELPDSPT